jgi:uncharacterized repeat protein (TIGR01451 family)
MNHDARPLSNAAVWPEAWRMIIIALCTLVLCSCRNTAAMRRGVEQPHGTLPAAAFAGQHAALAAQGQPCPQQGVPCPYEPRGPWSPDGLRQPWPYDEYVRDGGDQGCPAAVEMEDAVAQFNTLDGRQMTEPSNEVYIYSPRFGAVRQVVSLAASEERQKAGGVDVPLAIGSPTTLQLVADAKQNIQADNRISARPAVAMRTRQGDGVMSSVVHPRAFQDAFMPFENLSIIRSGTYEQSEKALVARGAQAAIAWSHVQAVQIVLDRTAAMAEVKYDSALSVYTACSPPGTPRLRLVKVASTAFAEPGDEVDFTLRFDNLGNEPLQSVVIVDSLNTRLEYVEGSAQCSVEARFSAEPNEGGSVVVRCELVRPLDAGQGGILRFRCRVR